MNSEYKPVIKTSLWSLVILGVYLTVLYIFKDFIFKWSDPTSEIRNVVLVAAAMVGLPFLILGHITRRQDFESKRKDQNYRSEASVNEFLMNQVSISAERFVEIITLDFSLRDREFQNSRTSNMGDLLYYMIYDSKYKRFDVLDPMAVDSLRGDLWFDFPQWKELNKHIQVIITSLRTKRDFTNSHFGKILSINMSSFINEDSYKILILLLCVKEFGSINPDNPNSELAVALKEVEELINLRILPEDYIEKVQKDILNFIQAEGMMQGREQ